MKNKDTEATLADIRARVAAVAALPDAPLDGQPGHMEANARKVGAKIALADGLIGLLWKTPPRAAGKADDEPNYNEFMQLVMCYGAAKAAYATAKQSGKYELRKEGRLKRQANAAFERVADAAARRFPGGKDYTA